MCGLLWVQSNFQVKLNCWGCVWLNLGRDNLQLGQIILNNLFIDTLTFLPPASLTPHPQHWPPHSILDCLHPVWSEARIRGIALHKLGWPWYELHTRQTTSAWLSTSLCCHDYQIFLVLKTINYSVGLSWLSNILCSQDDQLSCCIVMTVKYPVFSRLSTASLYCHDCQISCGLKTIKYSVGLSWLSNILCSQD